MREQEREQWGFSAVKRVSYPMRAQELTKLAPWDSVPLRRGRRE
jgi:hypothetical protein